MWEKKVPEVGSADLERLLRRGLTADFQPLVRVRSNRSHEWTLIYARPLGNRLEVMLLTHDSSDTVLIRADVDADALSRTVNERGSMHLARR